MTDSIPYKAISPREYSRDWIKEALANDFIVVGEE
jgi:hypothetical protein